MLGLSSCVDDKYNMENLDSTMELETDLVGPLAYSKLNIVDVLNTDSLGDFEIKINGDTMFIMKADSQNLGNELIDQLQVLPSTEFNFAVPVGLLNMLEPTEAEIDHLIKLDFPNINTNENERLDSILMGESNIDVTIHFPRKMKEGSYVRLHFHEDELLLNPALYPDNAIEIDLNNIDAEHPNIDTHINLYGTMLRLDGKDFIHIDFKGYVSTEKVMDASNVFEIKLDCSHMKPHVTFINIGNARDIVENEMEIDFGYAQDIYLSGMNLPFYDPVIYMTCLNNIGVPARYYIDYVEGISSSTGYDIFAAEHEWSGHMNGHYELEHPFGSLCNALTVHDSGIVYQHLDLAAGFLRHREYPVCSIRCGKILLYDDYVSVCCLGLYYRCCLFETCFIDVHYDEIIASLRQSSGVDAAHS